MEHYVYYSFEEFGRGYIGVRSCKGSASEDCYMGSFKDPTFKPTNKVIIETFETREEALEAEIELHAFFDVARNPLFANQSRQTSTGFDTTGMKIPCTPERAEAISKATKGRPGSYGHLGKHHSEETKEKLRQHRPSEESRAKMSAAAKGRKLSEETKRKLSEASKRSWQKRRKKI